MGVLAVTVSSRKIRRAMIEVMNADLILVVMQINTLRTTR